MLIVPLAFAGIALSMYALWVSHNHKKKGYIALCDLSKEISCTRAFSSKYSRMFGIHNAVFGIAFYALILVITNNAILIFLALLAMLATIHLAHISMIKMKNLCLVCNAIYLINTSIFLVIINGLG
ncbi:hypothetical protein GOV11_05125 [Candidatus Woesearchaeota archaeon]|nr:hypothetical protein [Candidatus Woesearchaeota archaeon]